ncbi:hypothetical protein BKA70DRAFT_1422605 [Coprinopsis sp. MPI-PUGE-AT-0042]|nr:hypothetical protein BKA70DRAFT_1422605 [Coprinopsis sp. MPI-PUGE-AT-0042]
MSKSSDSTGQQPQQPSDAGARPQRNNTLRRAPPSLYHNAPTSTSPTAGRSASGAGGDRHTHRLMEPKPLRLPLGLTSPGVAGGAYMFNTIQPSYATFGSNPSTPITSKDRRQRTPNPNAPPQELLRRPESSFFKSKTAAFRDDARSRRSPHPGPSERQPSLPASNTVYERHLLQHRHGFPLWMPQPTADAPPSYDDKGVSVGDVGIITPSGGFDFLFNICLPAEHPNNAGGPLPEGFVPLLTQQKDITESDGHPLGSHIASHPTKSVGAMAFECNEPEGAILVLPDGAMHEDIRNLGKFREYAASNAPSWYKLAVTICKREIDNGEIRLVTGCDKSSAWGDCRVFQHEQRAEDGVDGECDAKTSTSQEDGLRNQCTFVRCFTVSLCELEWVKLATINNPSDSVSETSTTESIASKFSLKARKFSKFFSSFGSKSSASSKLSSASLQSLAELSLRTSHPASVMNRVILQKIPQARLAITHDEDWALLSDEVVQSGDYVRIWDEVSQKFEVVMDPSGTAYVAEKNAKPTVEPVSPPLSVQYSGLFPFAETASLPGGLVESDFTVESLIEMISSPTAPTPAHVRLLSRLLSKQTPPRFSSLQPILPRLCNEKAPVALQALGYDVMTAYWSNAKVRNASWPTTSDALSCLTFFLKNPLRWSLDLWEVRYRALAAITKDGTDLRGLETVVVSILKDCIASAFRILTNPPKGGPSLSPAECERCITTVGKFLSSLVAYRPNVARLREEMFMGIFRFYADIVDAHIQLPPSQQTQALLSPRADATLRVNATDEPGSPTQRRPQNKRRTTASGLASMIFLSPPSRPEQTTHTPSPRLKHPAEIGIALYLTHASAHLQQLSTTQMEDVLPLLFRALAFVALPLPRLTLHPYVSETETLEDLIINLLHSLVPSPLASVAMRIIMQHLSPQADKFLADLKNPTPDPSTALHSFSMMIMTSLGATRAFRVYVRRALAANLERSYRPSVSAPQEKLGFRPNFTQELADLAWLKTDRGIGRPRVFASSIREWVHWQPELPIAADAAYDDLVDRISEAKETILEEAAGLLKDVYQEVDSRLEGVMDSPHELAAMDDAVKSLAVFLSTLKSPDGSPFIVNVFQPIESPTPLLRSITTLLSREFAPSEKHLLADILIDACEHVTDDNTARIPGLLGEDYGLMPMASSWIENWKPIIATLHEVYCAIQETPSYRAELIKLIMDNRDALIAVEGSEPIFSILEDEAVIEVSEREEDQAESTVIPHSIQLLIALVDADESPEPVALLAVQTLITIFSELSFTALSFQENNRKLSLAIFDTFLRLLSHMHEPQPRLLALQFLVRLRADRDHRVYFALASYDTNESVAYLASLINRLPDSLMRAHKDEILEEHVARNKSTRTRIPPSRATTSYTTGELGGQAVETSMDTREHRILWQLPETLSFRVVEPDSVKDDSTIV